MFLFYLYTIFAIICEISAQYIFKLHYINNTKVFVGIILYAFTGFFAYKLLKYETLAVANVLWHIVHFIILFLISIFVLKEKIHKQQIIAILFGIISIFLFITNNGHLH